MIKNVLIIGHHLVLASYQELVQNIADLLSLESIDVALVTPKIYKEKVVTRAQNYPERKFTHIKLNTIFGKGGRQHAHIYLGLGKVIEEIKPDIIFCMEEPNSLVSVQSCYLAKKHNAKIILWSALNQYRDYGTYKKYDIRRYLYPWSISYTFKNSDAINALDESVKNVLKKKNYPGLISTNNTFGVNNNFFSLPRENTVNELRVVYVGLLENYKGVKYLIEAIQNEDIILDIVGDGSERELLEEISKGKKVRFHGFQDHNYVRDIMSSSDVLVLPSVPIDGYLEQFGRVLIEAMASGLCVVASNIGGIPSVIDHAGFLVSHSSSDDLSCILERLNHDRKLLNDYKLKAYKRAIKHYSYHAVAQNITKLLKMTVDEQSKEI